MAINTASVANLRATVSPEPLYYITDLNKQGTFYRDDSDSTSVDNGATIITTPDGKRFKRIYDGAVNVKWFGATGNGTTADDAAIQAAMNAYNNIYFPEGTYLLNKPLLINAVAQGASYIIKGAGKEKVIIKKKDNTALSGISPVAAPGDNRTGITDNMNVDACFVVNHTGGTTPDYAYNISITDLTITCNSNSTYGFYAPRTAYFNLENIKAYNFKNGFFTYDSWLATFTNILFQTNVNSPAAPYYGFRHENDGSGQGTGTTNTLVNCFAENYNYGFYLFGLSYSSLVSCAAGDIKGTPFFFNVCHQVNLSGCGAENTILNTGVTGPSNAIFFIEGSDGIVINSFATYLITPDTIATNNSAAIVIDSSTVTFNGGNFVDFSSASSATLNIILQNGAFLSSNGLRIPANGNSFISYSGGSSWMKNDRTGTQLLSNNATAVNYFQFSQLNSTQITALTGLQAGITVFNTTTSKLQTWNGTVWNNLW